MLIWSIQSNNHAIRASMISTIRHWFVERGKFMLITKLSTTSQKSGLVQPCQPELWHSPITIFRYFPQLFGKRLKESPFFFQNQKGWRMQLANQAPKNTSTVEVLVDSFILMVGNVAPVLRNQIPISDTCGSFVFTVATHKHHPRHTASDPLTGCFARSTGNCKWEVVWHRFVMICVFDIVHGQNRAKQIAYLPSFFRSSLILPERNDKLTNWLYLPYDFHFFLSGPEYEHIPKTLVKDPSATILPCSATITAASTMFGPEIRGGRGIVSKKTFELPRWRQKFHGRHLRKSRCSKKNSV